MKKHLAISRMAIPATVVLAIGSTPALAQLTLEEVIVTAQKRDESLQDVPISVAAFSEEMLDNMVATDIADVAAFTPNVSIGTGQVTQPSIDIRGIGTSDFGVGLDPAVGVYIDGVYIARSGAAILSFNDLERVEILNGPQGTLFGRNAAAGAVQYITRKPENETEGWAKLTIGNYGKQQLEGVYNKPFTDNLYFRGSALVNQRDGYIKDTGDDRNDEESWGVVAALRWLPTDNLDILWRIEYDEIDQTSRADSSATLGPRDNGADFEEIENDGDTREWRDLFGTALHVNYDMGDVSFTSITSYRTFESFNRRDKDGSANPLYFFDDLNYEDNRAFSQEWRFQTSGASAMQWVVGANYFWENAEQVGGVYFTPQSADKLIWDLEVAPALEDLALFLPYDDAILPGVEVPQFLADLGGLDSTTLYRGAGLDFLMNSALSPFVDVDRPEGTTGRGLIANVDEWLDSFEVDGEYQSYAVFGDVSYDLNDQWTVTAGLRWTQDEKDFGRLISYNEFGLPLAFAEETIGKDGNPGWFDQSEKWDEITGRFVVDYHLNEDVLLYGSWATGYKSGGFDSAGADINAGPLEPEDVENLEFGIKSSFFDNRIRLNAAFFDFKYNNLQKQIFIDAECRPTANVGTYGFVGDDVEGDGFELAVTFLATEGLTLGGSTGEVNAEYVESTRQEVVNGVCETRDRSGDDFSNSPSNYNLFANYDLPLDNGAELQFSASYSFSEGGSRSSCRYQSPEGYLYSLSTDPDTGVLEVSEQSRNGPVLAQPPVNSCPSSPDRKQMSIRAKYMSADGKWEIALWAKNLLTEDPTGDPGGLGNSLRTKYFDGSPTYGSPREPEFYGLDVRYQF